MKNIIIIPARLKSTRLPNKLLLKIDNKIILQHVFEACKKSKKVNEIYIATDSNQIKKECLKFTSNVLLTNTNHPSGTDRIAQAVNDLGFNINDNIVNVQGDEPLIKQQVIDQLFEQLEQNNKIVTACHKIKEVRELINHNCVKVVFDKNNNALYFSRSPIPHHRDEWETLVSKHKTIPSSLSFYKHVGIYGYKVSFLKDFTSMQQTYLERLEKLEQLRFLEYGENIKMIQIQDHSIGIDTIEDYNKVKEIIENGKH